MRIERAHEHVEVAIVVRDLELRAIARRLSFRRLELEELRRSRRARPDCIVLPPVDHRRPIGAHRLRGRDPLRLDLLLGTDTPSRERETQRDGEFDREAGAHRDTCWVGVSAWRAFDIVNGEVVGSRVKNQHTEA